MQSQVDSYKGGNDVEVETCLSNPINLPLNSSGCKMESPVNLGTLLEDGELSEEETSKNTGFKVDVTQIETIAIDDQAAEIQSLGLTVYDQGILERGILNQVEEETKRRGAQAELASVSAKLKLAEQQLKRVETVRGVKKSILRDALEQHSGFKDASKDSLELHKQTREKEVQDLRTKKADLEQQLSGSAIMTCSSKSDQSESERERKIRMGEMTPFGTSLSSFSSDLSSVENYLKNQKQLHEKMLGEKQTRKHAKRKSENLNEKKQTDKRSNSPTKLSNGSSFKKNILFPKKKRKKEDLGTYTNEESGTIATGLTASEACAVDLEESGSEYCPSESEHSDTPGGEGRSKFSAIKGKDNKHAVSPSKKNKQKDEDRWAGGSIKRRQRNKNVLPDGDADDWNTDDSDWICTDDEYSSEDNSGKRTRRAVKREVDDGNEEDYFRRVKHWERHNEGLRSQMEEECHEFDHDYKIPLLVWKKLYKYQQVGVRWLWELHLQRCGGILGDEMGLGKTVQIISFLAGLSISKLKCRATGYCGLGPTLIVCPTTVMHQWVQEFHTWFPPLRVAVLHESGCYVGKRSQLVREIVKTKGIIITSYTAVVRLKDCIVNQNWQYVILDEGHKIRNPDAQVTLVVKQLRTPHRLILSGSPMQNNLRELWSLLDFVFPGKLGTLPVFMQEFAVPITQGGYSNASEVMVATAYKCATVLRDTISPYLLRRMKADVNEHIKLPAKNEQVLFCRLTDEQRNLYKGYLECGEVGRILEGRMQIFVGLINLRKICNHPHLYSGGPKLFAGESEDNIPTEERYGYWNKAGKMIVIEALLKMWRRQEHRVLIFTQSRQMLLIMENFVQKQGYSYLKLDGGTSIAARQPLIKKFNEDKSYFLMLLTTKVGGLGVNLTGANRIVIYDPDWNPATDTQARERAWRIGQKSSVTVYRLITAGTIEEKMYHRQIFKQFLCNKVLKDPRQRRFFKSNDLLELFTLKETDNDCTETAAIFAGTGSQVRINTKESQKKESKSKSLSHHTLKAQSKTKRADLKEKCSNSKGEVNFSQAKVERMKKLAHKLSLKVVQKAVTSSSVPVDPIVDIPVDPPVDTPVDPTVDIPVDPIVNIPADLIVCTSVDPIVDTEQGSEVDKGSPLTAHVESILQSDIICEQSSIIGESAEPSSDDELENMKQLALELSQELSFKVNIAASLNMRASDCLDGVSNKVAFDEVHEDAVHQNENSRILGNAASLDSSQHCSENASEGSSLISIKEKSETDAEEMPALKKSRLSETSSNMPDQLLQHKKHKKSKRHKKHKRKRNHDIEFEGEKVPNLVSASSLSNKTQIEEAAHSAKQDDYVLRKLFAKTGLQTAMQHDKVMESGHADFALVEGEARRVAEDAVKAMKASRRHCWNAMEGVPTWTGSSGSLRDDQSQTQSARPKFGKKKTSTAAKKCVTNEENSDKSREGSGSSGLLARIRARNMLLTENDEAGPSSAVPDNNKELLDDIRTFVAFGASVDGRATTDEIISQFRNRLPPQSSALFKQMLMQICEFHRLPSDQGVWKLIPEFNW